MWTHHRGFRDIVMSIFHYCLFFFLNNWSIIWEINLQIKSIVRTIFTCSPELETHQNDNKCEYCLNHKLPVTVIILLDVQNLLSGKTKHLFPSTIGKKKKKKKPKLSFWIQILLSNISLPSSDRWITITVLMHLLCFILQAVIFSINYIVVWPALPQISCYKNKSSTLINI